MLAQLGDKKDLNERGWIYEPKIDGTRGLAIKRGRLVRILNRRGRWIEWRYPEIVAELAQLKHDFVLDGEICVLDKVGIPNFSLLQSREQTDNQLRIRLLAREYPATYYVFDILELDGKDLTSRTLKGRKRILERLLPELKHVKNIYWTEDGRALWRIVRRKGLEGVMAKKVDSKYYPGKRSDVWLKIKNIKSADCVICGWTEGRRRFASLVLGQYANSHLIYVGCVGSGLTEREIDELFDKIKKLKTKSCPFEQVPSIGRVTHWVRPKLVVEVKYLQYSKGKRLRAPVFLRLRFDKEPKACILEANH